MSIPQSILSMLINEFHIDIQKSDEDHYRIEIMTERKRSQVVHLFYMQKEINSTDTSRYEFISPIGRLLYSFNYEDILEKNSKISVGAICIRDFEDQEGIEKPFLAVRATHLARTVLFADIFELINEVAKLADQLELEIYGKDRF